MSLRHPSIIVATATIFLLLATLPATTTYAQLACGHDTIIAETFPNDPLRVVMSYASSTSSSSSAESSSTSSYPFFINVSTVALESSSHCTTQVGSTAADPLTGSTYSCSEGDLITDQKRAFITALVSEAVAYLETEVIKTNPLFTSGRIESGRPIPFDAMEVACDSVAFPDAGGSWHYDRSNNNDASLTLLVSAAGAAAGTVGKHDDVAWSKVCAMDQFGRPLVGHLNFIASRVIEAPKGTRLYREHLSSVVHQIVHLLGFTHSTMEKAAQFPVQPIFRRNYSIWHVSSPSVVLYSRSFFGCGSLEGLELEGTPSSSSAATTSTTRWSSHWETRTVPNELMNYDGAGRDAASSVLSGATLALLQDLGYYVVDWRSAIGSRVVGASTTSDDESAISVSSTGFQSGCDFVNRTCKELQTQQQGATSDPATTEFCFPADDAVSTGTSLLKQCASSSSSSAGLPTSFGRCSLKQYAENLPPHFQYFPGNPSLGGADALNDYCPTRQLLSCKDSHSSEALGNTNTAQSRCFQAHQVRRTDGAVLEVSEIDASEDPKRITLTDSIRCLRTRCVNGMRVEINPFADDNDSNANTNGSNWVACPVNGSAGSVSLSSVGFLGTVECPPALEACTDLSLFHDESSPQFDMVFASFVDAFFFEDERRRVRISVAASLSTTLSDVSIVGDATAGRQLRMQVSNRHGSDITGTLQATIDSKQDPTLLEFGASYVALVPSCSNYCLVQGTERSGATADRSSCECTCLPRFTGERCDVCNFPYTGATCDSCEAGLVNFPKCSAQSSSGNFCPVGETRNQTGLEVAASILDVCPDLSLPLGEQLANCKAEACLCQAGVFDPITHSCNRLGYHACLTASCTSQQRVCESEALRTVLNGTSSSSSTSCPSNSISFVYDALEEFPVWCQLEACVSDKCPEEIQEQYCTTKIISGAATISPLLNPLQLAWFIGILAVHLLVS